ncbi:MAG: hypothetical protein GX446_09190 [Chthonomonadales bacterium]|nr:hypothetical protein [Chthonomonadales bacterium]
MTGKERIEQAFSAEGARAFGAVTCYQGIFLRDHWEQATGSPWWAWHDPDPAVSARPWIEMLERTGEDWYPVIIGQSAEQQRDAYLDATPEGVFRVSRSTGHRAELRREPPGGFQPDPHADHASAAQGVRDRDRLLEVMDALYGRPGARTLPDGCLALPQKLHMALGADHAAVGHVSAPLWRCSELWSFVERMTLVAEQPDLIAAACDRYAEHVLDDVATLREAGARIVWIEDCTSDLVSPDAFRLFGVEYLRRLTDAIRSAGMLSVHYYCGRPDDRWRLLLDTGADGLALEESKKGFRIDIMEVAERVQGRMTLLGNIDALRLMEHGSDAELEAEVARQCEAGRRNGGRFVISVGSPITPGTPLGRVRAYCDFVHSIAD